jgi:hypothetical protein
MEPHWNNTDWENKELRKKTCPSATVHQKIIHALTWVQSQASVVKGQKLTTLAMAWPSLTLPNLPSYQFFLFTKQVSKPQSNVLL